MRLWLVAKVVEWRVHYFVITSKRVVPASGVALRRVSAIPLDKITDIEFRQSQAGRMLGYGQFEVFSPWADPRMRTFKFLPYLAQLYLEATSALIFQE
jgi:Bacterial PH domain